MRVYAVTTQDSTRYDVALPEAGLAWEKVGPLFERYSVTLVGRVDEHWAETYQRIVESSPNLTRFRLDKFSGTVSFTCRATDGPVEVMAVLRILGEMLERVNREASFSAANPDSRTRPGRSSPTPAAPPPGRSGTKPRL
jgi:hypothetical protein